MSNRLFKVWNHSRIIKKLVVAGSLEELLQKAAVKLALNGEVRAVLQSDGTDIEDDEVLSLLPKDDAIMVLELSQQWEETPTVLTIHAEEQKETRETQDQSAGTSVHPSQIEMVNQSQNLIDRKPSSQLPNLCEYIKQKLLAQESHLVWTKLIQECAYYYLAHLPRIGLDNSSGDYREIGRNMYDAYPAIARDGTQPWSFFTKWLSQKIRRIRWDNKRRSVTTNTKAETKMPSPKRFRVGTLDVSEECDEETYLSHVKQMVQEVEKKEPKITHMQTLLKGTFNRRRQWIQQLPQGSVKPILDKFPCFKDPVYIMAEFRYILKIKSLVPVVKRFEDVFSAVSRLMSKNIVQDDSKVAVLKALESETAYRKGKGQKTKPLMQIIKLEDDGNFGRLLSSAPESAPKLVAIEKDEHIVNMAIVCDGTHILLETDDSIEAGGETHTHHQLQIFGHSCVDWFVLPCRPRLSKGIFTGAWVPSANCTSAAV
ncbi:uncharacterized protein LOC132731819 isoform X2 [Ruditapes philippinarum]|uniref:uncharacterized protein LOC132731819 isoform X2 n=1 Tax=Ruditapes philippinarum TaxID=129788 RepID=UPI00295A71A5|nr:uncharacterized protein LOC132731819 isoform X2 [Ruditapes philippinarum]